MNGVGHVTARDDGISGVAGGVVRWKARFRERRDLGCVNQIEVERGSLLCNGRHFIRTIDRMWPICGADDEGKAREGQRRSGESLGGYRNY